jgi:hypothetical protein
MRRNTALLLIILTLAFPVIAARAEIVESSGSDELLIDASREVEIENAGIVFVNDTFTLRAYPGGELAVSEFWTGFHESFINERRSFEIWQGSNWAQVSYSEESKGNFSGYNVALPTAVTLRDGSELKIRASYLFVNRVSVRGSLYEARLPVYPALVHNVSSFRIHVVLPLDAEVGEISSPFNFTSSVQEGAWVLDHESYEVGPLSNVNATISYIPSSEDKYILDCQKLKRHIIIGQGNLRVEDSYTLLNTGASMVTFNLRLPPDASNVNARDGIGLLNVKTSKPENETGYIDAYVTPRSTFKPYYVWSFTIAYSMPVKGYISEEGGKSTLTYPVYGFPHYIRDLTAFVTLPEGGRFVASNPEPTSTQQIDSKTQIAIDFGARLPSERPEIVVELVQSPFAPFIRPIALVLIAAGAIGSVYFLRWRRRVVEVKQVVVERPKLAGFLEQHRERISLLQELDGLRQELEDEKIGRDRFDQRSAEINRRRNELVRSLKQLGIDLEAEDPSLNEHFAEIRRAEEELERVNADLRNLDVRLRARRISRRDYDRRKEDRLKRRGLAIKRIEQALTSLGREK